MTNQSTEYERELSTHKQVADKLRARKGDNTIKIEDLTPYEHKAADETFYVGSMRYSAHKEWREVKRFEDLHHVSAGRGEDDPKDRSRSDIVLLANSVYTGSGEKIGVEIASLLLELEGGGPSSLQLLSLAEKANPPREHLAIEVAQMMNKSSIDAILWRLMMECGLGKVLIDYMSTHSTPEERDWAEREICKAAEVVYAFQPLFDAEDVARSLGITFREGINLMSMYETPEEAIEEVHKKTIENPEG